MESTLKQEIESYTIPGTLPALEQIRRMINRRETEIRLECGELIFLLWELVKDEKLGYTGISKEEVKEQAAPLIKKLEGYGLDWKNERFSDEEITLLLTGK